MVQFKYSVVLSFIIIFFKDRWRFYEYFVGFLENAV